MRTISTGGDQCGSPSRISRAMATTREQQIQPRTILFAEDDRQMRESISVLLTDAGFLVDPAENGSEALQRFREAPLEYDVIITDHDMPELDGLGLVGKLRQANFRGKIIVLSGGLSSPNADAYSALEVSQILTKPVRSGALIDAIYETCKCQRNEMNLVSASSPADA